MDAAELAARPTLHQRSGPASDEKNHGQGWRLTAIALPVTQAELLYGLGRKGRPAAFAKLFRDFLLRLAVLPWGGGMLGEGGKPLFGAIELKLLQAEARRGGRLAPELAAGSPGRCLCRLFPNGVADGRRGALRWLALFASW